MTEKKDESIDAVMYPADQARMDRLKAHNFFPTKFNFLQGHNSFRPGYIHMLLGTSGTGKSTVVRSLVKEVAKNDKVLVWLSEESTMDFIYAINKLGISEESLKNIRVISEQDFPINRKRNMFAYRQYFEEQVTLINPGVVFFDNITTNFLYESSLPSKQHEHMEWLKDFFSKKEIAMFIVAHTGAKVHDNQQTLIDLSDIRGSKTATNVAEYFYIYQRLNVSDKFFPFIRIRKAREYQHSGIFLLEYDLNIRGYVGDSKIDYETFKKTFNKRDH